MLRLDPRHETQRQPSLPAWRGLPGPLQGRVGLGKELPGFFQQDLSGCRQGEGPIGAFEQRGADLHFQIAHLSAERGLGLVQSLGGGGEATCFRDADEVAQVTEFQGQVHAGEAFFQANKALVIISAAP